MCRMEVRAYTVFRSLRNWGRYTEGLPQDPDKQVHQELLKQRIKKDVFINVIPTEFYLCMFGILLSIN